jgi:hypothetical protein
MKIMGDIILIITYKYCRCMLVCLSFYIYALSLSLSLSLSLYIYIYISPVCFSLKATARRNQRQTLSCNRVVCDPSFSLADELVASRPPST